MFRYYKHVDRFIGALTRARERETLRAWGIEPDELTERLVAAKQAIAPLISATTLMEATDPRRALGARSRRRP